MIRVELHCHTVFSKDSLLSPEDLLAACKRKGIDRVAITDHNRIGGALRARELDPQRVIVGEEIMTTRGELLAFFVKEEVPQGLTPQHTIGILRDQGAFISVSHPFDVVRKGSWQLSDLSHIASLVDAVEVFNARCLRSKFNRLALSFSQEYRLPGTAGSDAHTAFELGTATMLLPDFDDPYSFREALGQSQLSARLSTPWVHFFSRYAKWKKQFARAG